MQHEAETIIGASVKVEGHFVGSGNVIIDGHVIGTLKTNKDVQVRQGAVVKADIEGANVFVAGEVRGHITCTGKLEVTATGKIVGNVDTQTVAIAHGAVLHGKLTMANHEATASEK